MVEAKQSKKWNREEPFFNYRMHASRWDQVLELKHKITPHVLSFGLPPAVTAADSYEHKWKKLCLEEFHANLSDFMASFSRSSADSRVLVQVISKGQVRVSNMAGACPQETSAETDWTSLPTVFSAKYFSLQFAPMTMAGEMNWRDIRSEQAIIFDSFSSLIYRFRSLSLFDSHIDRGMKDAIVNPALVRRRGASFDPKVLLPRPSGSTSKLNAPQSAILDNLRTPVDYVQGPPGSGKSTFIVELLELRFPQSARVLLCTTTNKAIDSLTEKISRTRLRDKLLAIGNESRVGETTKQFLLENRIASHPVWDVIQSLLDGFVPILSMAKTLEEINDKLAETQTCFGMPVKQDSSNLRTLKLQVMNALVEQIEKWIVADEWSALNLFSLNIHVIFQQKDEIAAALREINVSTAPILCNLVNRMPEIFERVNDELPELIKAHILQRVRYAVCTAACAATLQDRMARTYGRNGDLPSAMNRMTLNPSYTEEDKAEADEIKYPFTHVVLDEAGAMLEPDVIGTIIHGCKFLLCVGDHLQLNPFTKWRLADQFGYNQSFLERFASAPNNLDKSDNMMTIQYRMHPAMATVVSALFYNGRVTTAPSVVEARSRSKPFRFIHVDGEEEEENYSFFNRNEIERVVEIVKDEHLLRSHLSIDVICFHKPQSQYMQSALDRESLKVDVIAVDAMQGREADVVVLSCVRTDNIIGFLRNANRLNVAISRAKEALYIVGHLPTLRSDKLWRKLLNHHLLDHNY
ncbi:hypothetical protein AC1031_002121 [Aphanomyces cochlioides]|nr:hypothetical protein AC1031_002121 [Aphanomyces cochlioides]